MAPVNGRHRGGQAGRVRIIGGSLRGSVLAVPERVGLRPTPNRLRETLFNWLQPHIAGARCLDLFAGSGALGIEALSRGAGFVHLVERDAALADALEASVQRLRQSPRATVQRGDALRILHAAQAAAFDIAFVDPPFDAALWTPVLAGLDAGAWLAPRAWIYVESPVDVAYDAPPAWRPERETKAGEVRGTLYRNGSVPVS